MRLGVLDLGSNTVHLLLVDAHYGAAPIPADKLKMPLRLSENLAADGSVLPDAVDRLVDFVQRGQRLVEDKGATEVMAFATSAVREAANQYRAIEAQRERQARAVTQARLLRDAEQRRLDTGESSLLVVNLRERTLLDEQVKLAALDAKRLSTRAALGVAIGAPAIVGF